MLVVAIKEFHYLDGTGGKNRTEFDPAQFWEDVMDDPADFVSPTRLPQGTTFMNPDNMPDQDLLRIYQHAYACNNFRDSVEEDFRFVYKQSAIERAVGLKGAIRLKLPYKRYVAIFYTKKTFHWS